MSRPRLVSALVLVLTGATCLADSKPKAAEVVTLPATALGKTALTANGRIQPHGLPTFWRIEYGLTPAYGSQTQPQSLPPRLAAFYRESWDDGLATWQGGMSGKDLAHHTGGGASRGFVRFSEPSGDDPNHIDGIGTLHLSSYFYPATHPSAQGQTALWGGGDPDLRDARIKLQVRGNNFVANGAELVWWTQSDREIAQQFTPNWRRANWAYTGYRLTDLLSSGKWETAEYRLENNSQAWTYGGHNVAQNRPNYTYWSINNSQQHLSCDFFHLLAFVDPSHRPTGSIDFDEFEVAYRNYSLTLPSNGGSLVTVPDSPGEDPARLTDGWRNGDGKMWHCAANPTGPVELVYSFAQPVTIQTVQIHQHAAWPSRDVEVLTSLDGQVFTPLIQKTIPETSPFGPNFAFLLERGLQTAAKQVKIRIASGYKPEHWGLGEIELFGTGAVLQTDDDWYFVNTDLEQLEPGKTYHYRLIATNAQGTVTGPDQAFQVPADTKPQVITGPATAVQATSAKLEGRLNPMGLRTEFHFEYGLNTHYSQKTPPQYGGLQITPRSGFAILTDLQPGSKYHYRLVATNETGTTHGPDAKFQTP